MGELRDDRSAGSMPQRRMGRPEKSASNDQHPDRRLLESFTRASLSCEERESVVRHLLRGCSLCGDVIRSLLRQESELEVDQNLDPCMANEEGSCSIGREELRQRLEQLLEVPRHWRDVLIQEAPELQTSRFYNLVLEDLDRTFHHDLTRILALSEIALRVHERLAEASGSRRGMSLVGLTKARRSWLAS